MFHYIPVIYVTWTCFSSTSEIQVRSVWCDYVQLFCQLLMFCRINSIPISHLLDTCMTSLMKDICNIAFGEITIIVCLYIRWNVYISNGRDMSIQPALSIRRNTYADRFLDSCPVSLLLCLLDQKERRQYIIGGKNTSLIECWRCINLLFYVLCILCSKEKIITRIL